MALQIRHLYVSPGHNYFGRHGMAPDGHEIVARHSVNCLAGRGIEGDRFCDYRDDYKGQITFFADEVYRWLCDRFGVRTVPPAAFRRNVITQGVDLNSFIGVEFELQGVRFLGTGECKPCHWMNTAFHPGAEELLKGQGGLRAKILTTGTLAISDPAISAPPRDPIPETFVTRRRGVRGELLHQGT